MEWHDNKSPNGTRRRLLLAGLAGWLGTGCTTGASPPPGPQAQPMSLPSGRYAGESQTLGQRLRGTLVARHRFGPHGEGFELDLRSGTRTGRAASGGWPNGSFSEPDAQGRVVFSWSRGPQESRQTGLDMLERSGQRRTLWQAAAPDYPAPDLALSFNGQALAFLVRAPGHEQSKGTPTVLRLWVLDTGPPTSAKPLLEAHHVLSGLVDSCLSWLGDNRHLAVVVQGPRGRAAGVPALSREEPDAQVMVVDTHTGQTRATLPGRQVWSSSDGASLLVRQHEIPAGLDAAEARRRRAWTLRPTDLVRRTVTGPDISIGPPEPLPHVPPEITAALGWLDDRYLVYRGDVTPGAPSGLTTGNSPLVGPKRLEAVKVMDTRTGEFVTVLEGVDPRSPVTVR